MSNLTDIAWGGDASAANNALTAAMTNLAAVGVPTAAQLTLPQLQQYVQAGILTPEQAQAYTVNSNAFASTTADNSGLDSELSTIGQLQDIVNQGGNDAEEKANIQNILNTLGTTESGQNAAILANNARQGISNSGLTEAAELAGNQNAATNANSNAMDAASAAEAREIAALSAAGTLGEAVQGQEYTQTANAANAADAIAQFNANQQQQEENLNVNENNKAAAANLAEAQNVSDSNTKDSQITQESASTAAQQAYEDALAKATAETGVATNQANMAAQQGQANAGILGGIVSAAGNVAASETGGNPYGNLSTSNNTTSTPNSNVNTNSDSGTPLVATGGRIMPRGVQRPAMNMKSGGPVPGRAMVPGDSPANDTQLAKLSPGEIVLPRSVTQTGPDPSKVMQFLRSLPKQQQKPSIHPKAVLDTLRGLSMHHAGVS